MRALAIAAGVAATCGALAPAAAAETILAGPPNQYFTASPSADQGEAVSFQNLDLVDHDVVAEGKGADGQPLFRSALVARGGSTAVAGTEFLTAGSYPFLCSIHPSMRGTLAITSAGQPKPRPGGSAGAAAPAPAAPAPSGDTTVPSVRLRVVDTRLRTVRRRKAVRVRITSSEPVTVGLTVRSGSSTLGGTTVRMASAGTRTFTVRLRRAARSRLALEAHAADAAGNAGHATASRRLR